MTKENPMTGSDVIGGFPYADDNCKGCGNRLLIRNAWMADGCPCNTQLGVNSMNETRWRLLMQLQQMQTTAHEMLRKEYDLQRFALIEWRLKVESAARDLEKIVCTKDPDSGVILLSSESRTHFDPEVKCQVYDHEHFSPLGDALIALHERLTGKAPPCV